MKSKYLLIYQGKENNQGIGYKRLFYMALRDVPLQYNFINCCLPLVYASCPRCQSASKTGNPAVIQTGTSSHCLVLVLREV